MTTFGHWAKVTVCWLQALFFFGVGRESQKEPGPGGCISFGLDEGSVAALYDRPTAVPWALQLQLALLLHRRQLQDPNVPKKESPLHTMQI